MKTLTFFLLGIILMIGNQLTYSYNVYINSPCVFNSSPTTYIYPANMIPITYRADTAHYHDTRVAKFRIYMTQNGRTVLMAEENHNSNEQITTQIEPLHFPNLGYNEPFTVKVTASSLDVTVLTYYNFAYAIIYKPGMSPRLASVTNGTSQLTNTATAQFISSLRCNNISTGSYFIKQYKLTFTITGNFNDVIAVVDKANCQGYSGALPNTQENWGAVISQTPTEIKFITFVYDITNVLGQQLGYLPCLPQQATVVYHFITRPSIMNLNQWPNPLSPSNNVGIFTCNLYQNQQDTVIWKDSNNIHNYPLYRLNQNLIIYANGLQNTESLQEWFSVSASACNPVGCSGWKKAAVLFGDDPTGCPYICYNYRRDIISENNFFSTSLNHPDKDVTDIMQTTYPFNENMDTINFSIREKENDITKLDMIELFRVAVDPGEEVAVTNTGEFIDYFVEEDKTKASLNSGEDVTELLRSADNEIVDLKKDEEINVEFGEDGSDYILITAYTPGYKQIDALNINTSNSEKLNVQLRSNMDKFCIKVKGTGFHNCTFKALQNSFIDRITVVKNENLHITSNLSLLKASSPLGDLKKMVIKADQNYLTITKDKPVSFSFKNEVNTDQKAFYFISAIGRYNHPEDSNKDNAKIDGALEFKLYDNLPNPFNPVTRIKYEIPEGSFVKLAVFDISGKQVDVLVNDFKAAGRYELNFDGSSLASGIYFYRLESKSLTKTKRMILIK